MWGDLDDPDGDRMEILDAYRERVRIGVKGMTREELEELAEIKLMSDTPGLSTETLKKLVGK